MYAIEGKKPRPQNPQNPYMYFFWDQYFLKKSNKVHQRNITVKFGSQSFISLRGEDVRMKKKKKKKKADRRTHRQTHDGYNVMTIYIPAAFGQWS